MIVDSNAARAFRAAGHVYFLNSTPPGYTPDLYVQCLKHAITDIKEYGMRDFQTLEPGTPLTRIYDKLTFITGAWIETQRMTLNEKTEEKTYHNSGH